MSITPETQPPRNDGPLHAVKDRTGHIAEAVRSGISRLGGGAGRYARGAREQLETTRDNALETVRGRPATSAAATFGLGLLAGAALMGFAARVLPCGARTGAQVARKAVRRASRGLHS